MKEIIEQLKRAIIYINSPNVGTTDYGIFLIKDAISFLQKPRYITPAEYKAETGKDWRGAVYVNPFGTWIVSEFNEVLDKIKSEQWDINKLDIVCAYFNDGPPPSEYKAGDIYRITPEEIEASENMV